MAADTADFSPPPVLNTVTSIISGTVGITDTDSNQPHVGVNTSTVSATATLAQGATSVIIAGVSLKVIRIIGMEITLQIVSGALSGQIEDTNGGIVYKFQQAVGNPLAVAMGNLALPVGAGLQFHNTNGAASSETFTAAVRYTQV